MNIVETIKNMFVSVGAGWVLLLLFGLGAVGVAIAVERWMFFRTKDGELRALAAELDAHLANDAPRAALEALRSSRALAAVVARAGLRLAPRGPQAAEKGMQGALAAERKQLEARLAYLGTLGNNAPFVGLFGTVIGVILAFEDLGRAGAGGSATAGAVGVVASATVMSAIAEALVATAVGIAVALPAVAAYNAFQRRIAAMLDDAEALTNLVLAYMAPTAGPRIAGPSTGDWGDAVEAGGSATKRDELLPRGPEAA